MGGWRLEDFPKADISFHLATLIPHELKESSFHRHSSQTLPHLIPQPPDITRRNALSDLKVSEVVRPEPALIAYVICIRFELKAYCRMCGH